MGLDSGAAIDLRLVRSQSGRMCLSVLYSTRTDARRCALIFVVMDGSRRPQRRSVKRSGQGELVTSAVAAGNR